MSMPPADRERFTELPYVAPRNQVEEVLAQAWSEVLGITAVGRDDSFFDLGGASLQATRICARLRAHLGVRITPEALFDAMTLADLADAIRRREIEAGMHGPGHQEDE